MNSIREGPFADRVIPCKWVTEWVSRYAVFTQNHVLSGLTIDSRPGFRDENTVRTGHGQAIGARRSDA